MTKISTVPHVLNLDYIEKLHAAYSRDRNALSSEWRDYFDSAGNGDCVAIVRSRDASSSTQHLQPGFASEEISRRQTEASGRIASTN